MRVHFFIHESFRICWRVSAVLNHAAIASVGRAFMPEKGPCERR